MQLVRCLVHELTVQLVCCLAQILAVLCLVQVLVVDCWLVAGGWYMFGCLVSLAVGWCLVVDGLYLVVDGWQMLFGAGGLWLLAIGW